MLTTLLIALLNLSLVNFTVGAPLRNLTHQRRLQDNDEEPGTVLTDLVPFDVQILLKNNFSIDFFDVADVVEEWIFNSFTTQLENAGLGGSFAELSQIILLQRTSSRRMQENNGPLYTANFNGAAFFDQNQGQLAVPEDFVISMQRRTLSNDAQLFLLLQESTRPGLGENVVDVRAYDAPASVEVSGADDNDTLQIVIMAAIAVAGAAFLFLLFAIVWAWRSDQRNRAQSLYKEPTGTGSASDSGSPKRQGSSRKSKSSHKDEEQDVPAPLPDGNAYEADDYSAAYPSMIGGSVMHTGGDSVITEDINIDDDIKSSLYAYNASAIQDQSVAADNAGNTTLYSAKYDADLTGRGDAASVSSMESYGYSVGYSLDGNNTTALQSRGGTSSRVQQEELAASKLLYGNILDDYSIDAGSLPSDEGEERSSAANSLASVSVNGDIMGEDDRSVAVSTAGGNVEVASLADTPSVVSRLSIKSQRSAASSKKMTVRSLLASSKDDKSVDDVSADAYKIDTYSVASEHKEEDNVSYGMSHADESIYTMQ